MRVAAKDTPVPYAPGLENAMLPQETDLLAALNKLVRY
jgi:pyruvate/2-oxoglutarate/acetoin dehydrogenase E1 component